MPFQYILTNLLVDVPGAQGAIFMDPEGESVEVVSRQATPYELKLEGAYHGIFLRRATTLARLAEAGEVRRLSIAGRHLKVISQTLREGYYVVLIMEPHTPLAIAGAALRRASDVLNKEIP